MQYREATFKRLTDLVDISSVDISCDVIPPGSEKMVKVGGADIVVHVPR